MAAVIKRYDFGATHAALRRYVDADLLAGVSSAVLVGATSWTCIAPATRTARRTSRCARTTCFASFPIPSSSLPAPCCSSTRKDASGWTTRSSASCPSSPTGACSSLRATSIGDTEPARSPITIRHLMSHSSGLSYGVLDPGTTIYKAYNERGVQLGPAAGRHDRRACRSAASVFDPARDGIFGGQTSSARWSRWSAASASTPSCSARILGPLGMVDTSFVVPEKSARASPRITLARTCSIR